MKTGSKLILVVVVASSLVLTGVPARADDTNEVRAETKPKKQLFMFPGGYPHDFILALDRHFRTRLAEILSIPSSLARAEVPKMRLSTENPGDALNLYNHVDNPLMGRWVWQGEPATSTNMNVLTLVPDKGVAAIENQVARVKAMPLAGVPESKWPALEKDVWVATDFSHRLAEKSGGKKAEGEIRIQPESKVLIVSGSDAFIEMVESVVAAHRVNAEIETSKRPGQ